jgi:hypothetical protein
MGIGKSDLLQGTLDVLILMIVALGPVHGCGIPSAFARFLRHGSARDAAASRTSSAFEPIQVFRDE